MKSRQIAREAAVIGKSFLILLTVAADT